MHNESREAKFRYFAERRKIPKINSWSAEDDTDTAYLSEIFNLSAAFDSHLCEHEGEPEPEYICNYQKEEPVKTRLLRI